MAAKTKKVKNKAHKNGYIGKFVGYKTAPDSLMFPKKVKTRTVKAWAIMSKRGFETAEKTESRAKHFKGKANWIVPCVISYSLPTKSKK